MANEYKQQNPADIAKSYVALNTLRDYIYQQRPKRFLASDVIEDIPSLRPFGSAFANVLPSAATISKDPKERKKQITMAVRKVNQASLKEHSVAREALGSALKFGLGSIPLSLGFGMLEKSFHVPGLKNILKGERPRFTFKENFSTPEKKDELKRYLSDATKAGIIQGSVFGATPALLSNSSAFKKRHLDTAAKALEEHPNISSLPGADLAVLNNINKNKNENPIKSHITNTLTGGLAGGSGALAAQGLMSGVRLSHNLISPFTSKIHNKINEKFHNILASKGKLNVEENKWETNFKEMLNKQLPVNSSPHIYSKHEIMEPLTWKGMSKPVLGLTALGLGLSGLGSYMSHPAHKNE